MKAHYLAYGLVALIMLGMPFAAAMHDGASPAFLHSITHQQKFEKIELSLHGTTQENKRLESM